MKNAKLLLIDSDEYTAAILLNDFEQRGFENVAWVANSLDLPQAVSKSMPDVVVFNYHFHQPDSLVNCSTVKLIAPQAAILVIVSAGPAMKSVRNWAKQTNCVDVVIEKPLSDQRFFMALSDLVKTRYAARVLETRAERLANMLPEGALSAMDAIHSDEAKMFQAAIVFTDIRRSSEAITHIPPREFFKLLNQSLSTQARHISEFEGSVIKYTGDGVMAIFRGMGRSYLAMRCALELARSDSQQILPFGIGVAEGLVLAGFVGDSNRAGQRRQYDVIGATVHLAARLCSMANSSEVIATHSIHTAARLTAPSPRPMGIVSIRGFDTGIDCVAFDPAHPKKTGE